uniref:C2H2-type domain-containing protein n=1 Tax=Tetranychus urticae TaxID=32264 RepID=T1JTV3_TETUR
MSFIFITDSERKVNIKTEPTDEEVPEAAVYAATPDWLCKKYKINHEDTLTRVVGYAPATADHGPLYCFKTIGRALIGSEAAKMAMDLGLIGISEIEKKDPLVQRFLLGGPSPSTRLVLEARRKTTERRIMTRKTIEREKRKNKMMESETVRRETTESPIFVFECTYCGRQWKRLAILKNHVLGTRAKLYRRRCQRIQCRKRLVEDGLLKKYKDDIVTKLYDAIPLPCPPPKKQIWAKITCKDPKLIDSNGKFVIPKDIAKEWLRIFKEMPK